MTPGFVLAVGAVAGVIHVALWYVERREKQQRARGKLASMDTARRLYERERAALLAETRPGGLGADPDKVVNREEVRQ